MDLGILIPILVIILFIWKIISSLRDSVKAAKTEVNSTSKYRNYDAPIRKGSSFVPYDSYEFAGVRGPKRAELQTSRVELINTLSGITPGARLWKVVVIPASLFEKYMKRFTPLRWDSEYTGIVVLKDGRRYLSYFSNGIYITAVENSPDGIPFSLEEIDEIVETVHWVSLETITKRENDLVQSEFIDKIVHDKLAPGNY